MASTNPIRAGLTVALLAASPLVVPAVTGQIAPAAAAVNVSVNIGTFYNGLSSYGDWTNYRGSYVWIPNNVNAGWRPYTVGHWVWTNEYGWMWVSNEPFGWAAYHYGRWGYSNEVGWYWVPGQRWAPAWVSWRNSDADVAWAPLPPERDDTVVAASYDTLPDYYWNVVPSRSFLAPSLSAVLVFDTGARKRVIANGQPGGNVVIRNNTVMNTFINVDFIRKQTGQPVKPLRVVQADKPGKVEMQGDQITTFVGTVDKGNDIKPATIVDVTQVKDKVKGRVTRDKPVKEIGLPANGQPMGANNAGAGNATGGDATGQPANGTDQTGKPAGKNKGKPKLGKDQLQNGVTTGTGGDATGAGQATGGDNGQPAGGTGQNGKLTGKNKGKPKLNKDQLQNGAATGNSGTAGTGQPPTDNQGQPNPGKKKLKRLPPPGTLDQGGSGMNGMGGQPDSGQVIMAKPKNKRKPMTDQNGMSGNGGMMNGNAGMNGQNMGGQNMGGGQGGIKNPGKLRHPPQPKLNDQMMNGQPGKSKGKKQACDPQTDPSCPPTLN